MDLLLHCLQKVFTWMINWQALNWISMSLRGKWMLLIRCLLISLVPLYFLGLQRSHKHTCARVFACASATDCSMRCLNRPVSHRNENEQTAMTNSICLIVYLSDWMSLGLANRFGKFCNLKAIQVFIFHISWSQIVLDWLQMLSREKISFVKSTGENHHKQTPELQYWRNYMSVFPFLCLSMVLWTITDINPVYLPPSPACVCVWLQICIVWSWPVVWGSSCSCWESWQHFTSVTTWRSCSATGDTLAAMKLRTVSTRKQTETCTPMQICDDRTTRSQLYY